MAKQFIGVFDNSLLTDMTEFIKRYSDTYLFLEHPNFGKVLCFCKGFSDHSSEIKFFNEELGNIYLNSNTDVKVSILWPETKLINYENNFYYLTRIPERQWKRAPNKRTIRVYSPIHEMIGIADTNKPFDKILEQAYKPEEHTTILQAINELKNSSLTGKAINNNFAVSLPTYKTTAFILWYNFSPIAYIKPKTRTIEVQYQPLKQEILDFIRDYEQNSWNVE